MGKLHDLIIIGAGSAGMSAAIYAGRAKLHTLVLERDREGGQIKITSEVENYPGILKISGEALSKTMREQATHFGVGFQKAVVESVDFTGDIKRVRTVDGEYEALAVIVATGAEPRTLGFTGEDKFRGRGVGYCATCDGEFFSGMDIFVIGGGLAATEEALFLTRFARKVTIVVRGEKFTVPNRVADKVAANPKIQVHFNTELVEAGGDAVLRFALFRNKKTGETWRYDVPTPTETFGIFVFAGYTPQSAEYANALRLDEGCYIPTDEGMRTNVDGVYAAGDVRPKELRQLVTAVADGAIAATNAEKYVEHLRQRLALPAAGEEPLSPEISPVADSTAYTEATMANSQAEAIDPTAPSISTPPSNPPVPPSSTPALRSSRNSSLGSSLADPVFFDDALAEQLAPILERLERDLRIVAVFDGAGEWAELEGEIRTFLSEFSQLTDKVVINFTQKGDDPAFEQQLDSALYPTFALADESGHFLGVQFHGVPAGHEINSFVLALYNAAGPGQTIDESVAARIAGHDRAVNIKVGVSLSCTLCPDVVAATQLMALRNPLIKAEMIDVAHFPEFKNRWNIMSVPALVIDDARLDFGKKSLEELLDLIAV